jgi:hypothetical protein
LPALRAEGATIAFNGIASGLAAVGSFFASATGAVAPEPRTENLPGSFDAVKAVYGSSVTEKDLQDLAGKNQGGAVALALPTPPKNDGPSPKGEIKGAATEEFVPLIPPPLAIVGGTPGFGGGGGDSPAVVESEAPASPPEETAPVEPTPTQPEDIATTTPPVLPVENTLLLLNDFSTLGQTQESQGGSFPGQKMGKGISGTVGLVAYKVHGTNLPAKIADGLVSVQIYNCFSQDYTPIGFCRTVSTSTSLQIASQMGDDATVLATMSPYEFDPINLYMIIFFITGDMAMYGGATPVLSTDNEYAVWTQGPYFSAAYFDTQVTDWGFRICDSASCSF